MKHNDLFLKLDHELYNQLFIPLNDQLRSHLDNQLFRQWWSDFVQFKFGIAINLNNTMRIRTREKMYNI